MPDFLAPEAARFDLLDGAAVLWLPTVVGGAGPWSLMSRRTMCIVDGPGDEGYLVARMDAEGTDAAPAGWDEAVERHGGCQVRFGPDPVGPTTFVPSQS